MKRKLMMMVLSVAVTLALIPTMAAYADELDLLDTPPQVEEDVEDQQEPPDNDLEENEDVEEDGEEDVDQEESVELELPKINLKSPVSQFAQSEIGTQYTLTARVGEKVMDPSLVTWSSDNESIATISPEGIVTIVGVGKANFTAVMIDGSARNGYAKVFVFADKSSEPKKEPKKHK
jgi:hypothetical protein